MAKKSSKHQSKPANTATTEPVIQLTGEPATTEITASPPAAVSSPSSYKPITDTISIERLVGLAKDSPPDSALGIVWKRAYETGYQNGRKEVLQNLVKKLEERFIEGEKEGIAKGKERYYGKGIVVGECEEHKRWKAAGHGDRCFSPIAILDSTSTQTEPQSTPTTSICIQTSPTTLVAASQTQENRLGKTSEMSSTSEISTDSTVFFSSTQPATSSALVAPSVVASAHETRPKTADFAQKRENVEKSYNFTSTTPRTPSSATREHTNDIPQAYASSQTSNDAILHPSFPSPTASSLHPPASNEHGKSALPVDFFESQPPTESPAPICVASAFKTRPASPHSVENCKKDEKSPIFTQNQPNSLISDHFNWADDVESTPTTSIIPTKHPRDLSELRSSTVNPFSSLHRRFRNRKKHRHFVKSWPQPNCQHAFCSSCHRISASHSPRHPSQPASLDWNQDPRLADLSNALQALGWVRR